MSRGIRLLMATSMAAVLGAVVYFQAEPSHLANASSTADVPALPSASSILSVDALNHAKVCFDQGMQKAESILASTPAHTRATVVVVGSGLVAMSPLGFGVIPQAIIYTASKVLLPEVEKFISL